MKNLAVIFPGIGYSVDRPLLYYARKIVKRLEFDIVDISYGKLPQEDRKKSYDYAMLAANAAINKISFEQYDNIFFISKSLGTLVAGSIQQNLPQKVNHIWFTPVTESVTLLSEDSLVFTSSKDPLIRIDDIMKRHGEIAFELHVSKEADHSLELGDIQKDISMLRKVEEICEQYILKRI